jgi:hypothetical protein
VKAIPLQLQSVGQRERQRPPAHRPQSTTLLTHRCDGNFLALGSVRLVVLLYSSDFSSSATSLPVDLVLKCLNPVFKVRVLDRPQQNIAQKSQLSSFLAGDLIVFES